MRRTYLYCEADEGGMTPWIVTGAETLSSLRGWMDKDCREEDCKLVTWMLNAAVGTYTDHRLGVLIRLQDQ